MYELAHCFFGTPKDREYVLLQIDNLKSQSAWPKSKLSPDKFLYQQPPTTSHLHVLEEDRNLAHKLSQRFKKEVGFSAVFDQDLLEFLHSYEKASNDYISTGNQSFRFVHYLFEGEAKRFYFERGSLNCQACLEAI